MDKSEKMKYTLTQIAECLENAPRSSEFVGTVGDINQVFTRPEEYTYIKITDKLAREIVESLRQIRSSAMEIKKVILEG